MTAKKATKAKKKAAKKTSKKQGKDIPETTREILTKKRNKHTPAVFKLPSMRKTPVVFSLDDVREVLKKRETKAETTKPATKRKRATKEKKAEKKPVDEALLNFKPEHKKHSAASLEDILGLTSEPTAQVDKRDPKNVPRKFKKHYNLLLELRQHLCDGLNIHTQDTLKHSSKEETGDVSSYSQHLADAGTDTFDRDFALSLVSSEQDALYEVEEAIDRIFDGTYGICEKTGEKIDEERLEAVPFTRFSLDGQRQHEQQTHKTVQRGGVFVDTTVESAAQFRDEDSED